MALVFTREALRHDCDYRVDTWVERLLSTLRRSRSVPASAMPPQTSSKGTSGESFYESVLSSPGHPTAQKMASFLPNGPSCRNDEPSSSPGTNSRLKSHKCAIMAKRVVGIELTRESTRGIRGASLAESQALVGKRMTFSQLRLQKGAVPLRLVLS